MEPTDSTASVHEAPYVGLNYYTEDHAEVFFGRDAERATIISNLRAARLTLLYAQSGVGKSSLLRAGVASRLRKLAQRSLADRGSAGYIPVVFSSWRDEPVDELIGELENAIKPFATDEARVELPRQRLDEAIAVASAETGATLLVILDQFEEYFLYSSREATESRFAAELARCLGRSDLRANFLIAVREDAYAGLGDLFKGQIENVYGNYLHLEYLDPEAARQAIVEPVEHYNALHPDDEAMTVEPALVEAVLEQVRTGQVMFEQEGAGVVARRNGAEHDRDEIETPYLQLVMTTLWEHERSAGSRVLRLSTLRELGGAKEIVRTHLDRALGGLPDNERETAVDVFHHLVTPSGTKIVHRIPDLAAYSGRDPALVESLVEKLTSGDQRILRPVPAEDGDGRPRVEIFHDVLAPAILAWRSSQSAARLERERRAADERAHHERNRARIFRSLAVISMALMIVAVVAVVLALNERSTAVSQSHTAQSQLVSDQASTAFGLGNLRQASLLAVEAFRVAPTVYAQSVIVPVANSYQLGNALTGHASSVSSVALSPDGKTLASGSADKTIGLWDLTTRREIAVLPISSVVESVAFSPDGRTVASAGDDGTVRLWDVAARRQLASAHPGGKQIYSVAFSPDGKTLASGGADKTVRLWNVAGLRQVAALSGHSDYVEAVRFSPDGKTLASASDDQKIMLWNVASHRRLATLRGHTDQVVSLAFSPNGKTLASGSVDATVRLWDVGTRRPLGVLRGHSQGVYGVAFAPDGTMLASGSEDGTIVLWDVATHRQLATPLSGSGGVNSLVFTSDGKTLVSGDADNTIRLWAPRAHMPLSTALVGHGKVVTSVSFSRSGRILASGSADHTVRLWNPASGRELSQFTASGPVTSVAVSPDGSAVAAGSADHKMWLWDVRAHRELAAQATSASVTTVAFSPDDKTIAAGARDGTITLWGARTGGFAGTLLVGHGHAVNSVAFSPDGNTLAIGSADHAIHLWQVDTHRQLAVLSGHSKAVLSVAFAPDGKTLASGSADQTIMLWSVATHRQVGIPISGDTDAVTSVAFGPDGKTLASGSADNSIVLWDIATRIRLVTLLGQNAAVKSVAFSPSGNQLASGSADDTVRLWPQHPVGYYVRQVCDRYIDLRQARRLWQQSEPTIPYRKPC